MTNEISYLGGKVLKQSLPALQPPTKPDAPRLKRLLLPQGELAQIHDGPEGFRYIATLELQAGSVRGNHYHKVKKEWFYLMTGALILGVKDVATGAQEQLSVQAGDLVFISTEVAHAFRVERNGYAIEFSVATFDPQDTFRCPVM